MANVANLYPILPDAVHKDEKIPDSDSSIFENNSKVTNDSKDSEENRSDSDIKDIDHKIAAEKQFSNVLKDFFKKWHTSDCNKEKEKIRNEINDAFLLKNGEAITTENLPFILDKGDFFVARRIWNVKDGKCHDHFVFVKEK